MCGYNYGGTVQKSYNAGAVTAAGTLYVGGVCGYNYDGTVQECYNTTTGKVSGKMYVGGVCGDNNKTVQDCYNTASVTGEGTSSESIGGICGQNKSTVKRCYNTGVVSGKNRVGAICGEVSSNATTTDCYYLAGTNENAFGYGSGGANCDSKTELKFQNGEVAYLLQEAVKNAATAGTTAPQVWGQKIGTDLLPVLSNDANYKVYPTAEGSPCKGYSNTANDRRDHKYENGECIYCGETQPPQVAYTVTIPATVQLGDTETTATISATGVVLPTGKQLNVKVDSSSKFTVTLDGTNEDEQAYTVNNGAVNPGDTVLSVSQSTDSASTDLTFNPPSSTTYSGTYTGTVTFTVSVDNKTS